MALKVWHTVVSPREDLRDGKTLDASEFAAHLDQVRDGRATKVYQNPEQFFDRTYLTQNLTSLAVEVNCKR
jgi:predicted AAA+ superfamily ATPase